MIRKWFKLNTCLVKVFKNSTVSKNLKQKWILENADRNYSSLEKNSSFIVSSALIDNINKSLDLARTFFDLKTRNYTKNQNLDYEPGKYGSEAAEPPLKTEFLEVKGPNGAAFLIEAEEKDLEEVKNELTKLQGEYFRFDQNEIGWFTMVCIFEAESTLPAKDQQRLAKVHGISCGSAEVYEEAGKYFFAIPLSKMVRAKRILEKFGYKISKTLYKFHPRRKVALDDRYRETCNQFIKDVERLPQIVSIIHNF